MQRTREQWLRQFEPQPVDLIGQQKINHVQTGFQELVKEVYDMIPDSDHKTVIIRKLLEVKQLCVHAIAHVKPDEKQGEEKANEKVNDSKKGNGKNK